MKCFECNTETTSLKGRHHYKESGLNNIYLEGIDTFTCPSCGESFSSIPAMPKLHSLIGDVLTKKKGRLAGKEIRFLRKNARISAKDFAKLISIDNTTLSKWENDSQRISKQNDKLIRLVYRGLMDVPGKDYIRNEFQGIADADGLFMPDIAFVSSGDEWTSV